MWKPSFLLLAAGAALAAGQVRVRPAAPLPVDAARLWVECVPGGETVVRLEAESDEPLAAVELFAPDGSLLVRLSSFGARGLTDLKAELPVDGPGDLAALGLAGEHALCGRTLGGRAVVGRARLVTALPDAPVVRFPPPGAAGVPADGLTVVWQRDERASGGTYVELEQDDNDGLTVVVPPGRTSFRVPPGILRPGTATHLEVGAIGANGNRTVVQVPFTTR